MAGKALDEAQDSLLLRSALLVVLLAALLLRRKQFLERDAENGGNSAEKQYGDVAFAGFELGKGALGDFGFAGEGFAGHTPPFPKIAHAGTREDDKLIAGNLRRSA